MNEKLARVVEVAAAVENAVAIGSGNVRGLVGQLAGAVRELAEVAGAPRAQVSVSAGTAAPRKKAKKGRA